MNKLTGKVAIITGAARGIGLAFAKAYVKQGAKVVIADINLELAQSQAENLGENALAIRLDVSKQDSIDNTVKQTLEAFGQIDILINNAALFDLQPIADITRESYDKLFSVNFAGSLFMLQAVAKQMIARGQGGKIINMASQAGRRGEPYIAVYCATKAAVISLTQSAALNLAEHKINVNAISPGVVDNEHWVGVDAHYAKLENLQPGEKKAQVAKTVPLRRFAQPEEIAPLAVFLASSDADYITAQTYNIDGGNWMS